MLANKDIGRRFDLHRFTAYIFITMQLPSTTTPTTTTTVNTGPA
jgi:hypothetical protein